ncbi:sugar transferase [Methylosinus sporium]|uniref:sugar transferase n=1 Tax=Methylosinus sporium TaxID=428 RepID=UPI00383B2A84
MTHKVSQISIQTRFLIRATDILLSGLALLLLAPLLALIMLALRLTGEGDVFFRQRRIGKEGREFELFKFATMLKNSPSIGAGELTLADDPRVLPLGRFLRRTKLNELPQLLNILKGDLSIIGPRPQTSRFYNSYRPEDRVYVSMVRPGLSGVGSVLFRDEEKLLSEVADPIRFDQEVIMPYKGRIERWFVCNQSVSLYFELIFSTLLVVLCPRTGYHRRLLIRLPPPPEALRRFL